MKIALQLIWLNSVHILHIMNGWIKLLQRLVAVHSLWQRCLWSILDHETLDCLLSNWEFMLEVFLGGYGHRLIFVLTKISPLRGSYAHDTLLWLRYCYHRFIKADEQRCMEEETLSLCPPESFKYKEARARLGPIWATRKVLGGYSGCWPPSNPLLLTLEVRNVHGKYHVMQLIDVKHIFHQFSPS